MPGSHTSINLQDLMRVLLVSELGSINKAAQSLHVAQPALTRTVRAVEQGLGVQIFQRGAKGVTLTPEGETLITHARNIRAQSEALRNDIALQRQGRQRDLTIGLVPMHPVQLLAKAMLSLQALLPYRRICMDVGDVPELLPRLESGKIDFIFGPVPEGAVRPGLAEEILYHEELCIVCGRASPLYGKRKISNADLSRAHWIIGAIGSPSRERMNEFCRALGIRMPEIAIEGDVVPARRALVIHSQLLSLFQRSVVLSELRSRDLYALPLEWPQDNHPIGLIRLNAGPPDEAITCFAREVRHVFGAAGLRTFTPGAPLGRARRRAS